MNAERLKNSYFILGQDTLAMRSIEETLKSIGARYGYATTNHGAQLQERRPSRNPLAFAAAIKAEGDRHLRDVVVLVGCAVEGISADEEVVLLPTPELIISSDSQRYWELSVIGRIYTYLDIEPTKDARLLAAVECCFAGGLLGRCPGVDPMELIELYCSSVPKAGSGVVDPDWRMKIEAAKDGIMSLPVANFGEYSVRTLMPGRQFDFFDLVASCLLGVAVHTSIKYGDKVKEWLLTGGNIDLLKFWLNEAKSRGGVARTVLLPGIKGSVIHEAPR